MTTIRLHPSDALAAPASDPTDESAPAPADCPATELSTLRTAGASELEEFGERLARRLLPASHAGSGFDPVLAMLEAAPDLLQTLGGSIEVVRTKEGCAVVRTLPQPDGNCPCQPIAAFLEALPRVGLGVPGTLIETTCVRRGGGTCLFTLLWEPASRRETPAEPDEIGVDSDAAASLVANLEVGPSEMGLELVALSYTGEEPLPVPAIPVPSAMTGTIVTTDPERVMSGSLPGSTARVRLRSRGPRLPYWLKRRGWLLVLLVVAGVAGGTWAAKHEVVSYQAQSTMVVQSGASSTTGPGGAAEAEQLAITYATLIPTDSSILNQAATRLGVSPETVSSRLTVSVQTGTAVFFIAYKAPTPEAAVAGAVEVARVVGGSVSSSSTIPSGTVSVVDQATGASPSGSMAKYGKELGGILGLVLGLILVAAAERTDRRVDTAAELATVVGCPASAVLEDLSAAELTRAIALEPTVADGVTIVPLDRTNEAWAAVLASRLRSAWPSGSHGAPVTLSPPFETDPTAEAEAVGPTVLVVSAGERVRRTASVAERLNAVHRGPVWAVLVSRRARRKLVAGAV